MCVIHIPPVAIIYWQRVCAVIAVAELRLRSLAPRDLHWVIHMWWVVGSRGVIQPSVSDPRLALAALQFRISRWRVQPFLVLL